MRPERWQQIDQLLGAALELDPAQWPVFLDRACASDEGLRREVESLLRAHERAGSFIETPPTEDAAGLLGEGRDEPLTGEQLGPYKVMELLGRGGMGEVYLALDATLGRKVAVKLLPPSFAQDEARVRRFEREARAASALNHPNILTIHEVGKVGGRRFIITEYVEGETLRQRLEKGVMGQGEALDVATQVAGALAAAHAAGIVHRDIKPENIMLRADGYVKVLDFGLAKLTEQPRATYSQAATLASASTDAGVMIGTVTYMSPEQARGLAVDARTDVWSLGVVLYEMLTGEVPFGGETNGDVIVSVLEREPLPLTHHLAEAPTELQRIVAKSLCKEREERYQNVRDVLLDLKSLREELEFAAKLENSAGAQRGGAAAPPRSDAQVVDTGGEPVARTRAVPAARVSAGDRHSSGWIRRHRRGVALTLAGLGLVLAALLTFELRPPPPKIVGYTQLTNDGRPKRYDWPMATDGARLYFGEWIGVNPGVTIWQVSVAGGETAPILLSRPGSSLAFPRVRDVSPDKSELLFVSQDGFTDSEQALWVLPLLGGSPRRVGDVRAHEAAWSPDGLRILYANGNDLYLVGSDGTDSRRLLTVPGGQAWFIHWSPDGSRLRFTLLDDSGLSSLWEVSADGSNLHQILPGWNNPASECCGMWTPDGRYYVFISYQAPSLSAANGNVWAVREQGGFFRGSKYEPVQLTSGPLSFTQLVPSLDGKRLFARGELRRGELVRYDATAGQFVTYLSGISAQWVDFSRDGAWVTYVAYPEGTLWRSRADGSERLQLSSPPMRAALPRWSPDGRRIAFMGKLPGKTEQIYLVSAEGGAPEVLTPSEYVQGDPVWSPDGNRLVFGLSLHDKTAGIHLIDLSTKRVSMVPGSEALFSPRWSPDGRYLAALSSDYSNLMLYDLTAGRWEKLAEGMFGYPSWSRDGKYIYYEDHKALAVGPAIFRLRLSDRKIEPVVDLKNFPRVEGGYGEWSGLAPDDSVIALHDVGSQELYALDLQAP